MVIIKKIKNVIWVVLRQFHLAGIVQLTLKSALKEDGWFLSFDKKESIDKNGDPIPWLTYSSIKFIEKRLKKNFNVFEYGCGNSTIWFANKVHSITSVEHDKLWLSKVKSKLPENAVVHHYELNSNNDYAKSINETGKKFNVVIIDGRQRNECVRFCLDHMTDDGIIIFDNTQENDYKIGIDFLYSNGFREIEFQGILPIVSYNNTTSIFYRSKNCFNI